MATSKNIKHLVKVISYVLGHRPDEFGLVLNPDGFVKIKELLKALNEEDGLTYLRPTHLNELIVTLPDPLIEIQGSQIRATCRDKLPDRRPVAEPPKLLFTCVRRKAYPVVCEQGVRPSVYDHVVLSSRRELAERMGRRTDAKPVLLTVHTRKAIQNGTLFFSSGADLYLATAIDNDAFSGPALPKPKTAPTPAEIPEDRRQPKKPGSFILDLEGGQPGSRGLRPFRNGEGGRKRKKIKKERPPWRR